MRLFAAVALSCVAVGLAGCSSSLQLLTVTAVTPTTVVAGKAGIVLHVTGTQFTTDLSVLLNTTVLPTTFVSGTVLTATVPSTVPSGTYALALQDNGNAYTGVGVLATGLTVSVTSH